MPRSPSNRRPPKAPPKTNIIELGEIGTHPPRDIVRAAFAAKMENIMVRKGWSQSEFARRVEQQLPDKQKFGRDNINKYIRKGVIPSPVHLLAISKATGVDTDELLPSRGYPTLEEEHPPLNVRDMNDGTGWLRVNQRVSWSKLVQILEILKNDPVEKTTKESN